VALPSASVVALMSWPAASATVMATLGAGLESAPVTVTINWTPAAFAPGALRA